MGSELAFEVVPGHIDFFISNPFITGLLTGRIGLFIVVFCSLAVLYVSILAIAKHNKTIRHVMYTVCVLVLCLAFRVGSQAAIFAVNPMTQQIIASNIYDKAVVRGWLHTDYYFLVRIENRIYGVITNEQIYNMPMYNKGAPFDYSLYTYEKGGKDVMYRFLRPEFKIRAQHGNLQ